MIRMQSASAQLISPILVRDTLTEGDILLLQDAFLCNGLHYIKVNSEETGRTFIYSFLDSLGMSGKTKTIGYLTMGNLLSDEHNINIQDVIQKINPTQPINEDSIEQFFIEHCYYDFIWVELSSDLEDQPWFGIFKKHLNQYHHAPIILMSFDIQ